MNSDTTKRAFPGYDAEQQRIAKQEQERVAKAMEKANKAAAKRVARDKKRAGSLPPFLMVRSGLLNQWVWSLIPGGAFIGLGINEKKLGHPELLLGATEFLLFLTFLWASHATQQIQKALKYDIWTIRQETNRYMNESNYQIDLTDKINSDRLARILVQHISKYNPVLFDKMMQNPDSVADINVAENIILGHLKSHPDAAQKILDAFPRKETFPKKLYSRLNRYANRLKQPEKTR